MPSLLIVVFVLQLAIHLVNTIGASTVNSIVSDFARPWISLADLYELWSVYNRLPTPTSAAATKQRKLQREFVRQRKELSGISSQNEFARWAKLRRQHDRTLAELEKTSIAPSQVFLLLSNADGSVSYSGLIE